MNCPADTQLRTVRVATVGEGWLRDYVPKTDTIDVTEGDGG